MRLASCFLIKSPFKTAKRDPKKEDINAYIIPNLYWLSKLKMIYKPRITNKPRIISNDLILLLKKIGSINEVKNAPVLIVTKATETLETLMALKKKIQCVAIIIPVNKNLTSALLSTKKDFFLNKK